MRRAQFFIVVAASLATAACGGDETDASSGAGSVDAEVTFYRDVKPLIDAKCASCHSGSGIAPFSLTSAEDAVLYAHASAAAVESRTMPPWLAEPGCTDYLGDRSLTDEQIATFRRWADLNAPVGDPADVGAPLDTGPELKLSNVDVAMEMTDPYTAEEVPDDYRCFVLDWPETTTKYITGFNARPGNPSVVHHVLAFVASPDDVSAVESLDAGEDGPGYTCFGGPGFGGSMIGGWAPGGQGSDFAPGTGVRMEPGSKIVMQVHYNTDLTGPQPDLTRLEVSVADSVDKDAWSQFWANPAWLSGSAMSIPPYQDGVSHEWSFDPTPFITDGDPVVLYSANLHMHNLGKSGRLEIERADGSTECLLSIGEWDFHWQNSYPLMEPKTVYPGDRIKIQCTWDNPTANEVTWGEGTSDEMCLGASFVSKP
jgi:hypothetical protein